MTDSDVIGLLRDLKNPHLPKVQEILLRCRDIGFARDTASAEEFNVLMDDLLELIQDI